MTSKDSKTFEKLKQFFRINKGATNAGALRVKEDYTLTVEQEREISSETSLSNRIKAIKELSEVARSHRLEDKAVETLWTLVKDLLSSDVAKEHRNVVFTFIKCIIVGQYETLGIMRKHIFNFIKSHNIVEDLSCRLELLESLTNHGHNIVYLEEEICSWLTCWGASELVPAGFTIEWLQMSINLIKYNGSFLDDEVINAIVQSSFYVCCHSQDEKVVIESLQLLDTIICYSYLPPPSLPIFIAALCHTANSEAYCAQCWKTMRKLLGTHMGYSALHLICQLLHKEISNNNIGIIRGGVFYINMALWSNKCITSFKISLLSVLPSIYFALSCDHPLVVLEVVLGMECLITKSGVDLQNMAWEKVLKILKSTAEFVNRNNANSLPVIVEHINETLSKIETLVSTNLYNGSLDTIYDVIETFSLYRPESSIFKLMAYRKEFLVPTQYRWIENLTLFLNHFYIKENRATIRIHAVIHTLEEVYHKNSSIYENEIMAVILSTFGGVSNDSDSSVRQVVCQLIIRICSECSSQYHIQLLEILEKILLRPYQTNITMPLLESEIDDIKLTVEGLSKLFAKFIYNHPMESAEKILDMLVIHLQYHYDQPTALENFNSIRLMIFELLSKLRADSRFRLGIQGSNIYSPFIYVDRYGHGTPFSPNFSTEEIKSNNIFVHYKHISLAAACKIVITALKEELDWKVLCYILTEVPQILKHKALILSGNEEFDPAYDLVSTLCFLVNDKSVVKTLKNTPSKWLKTDFQIAVYPALAAFVSYHNSLEPPLQQKLVKCLQSGLVNRCIQPVVMALTTCILEMRDIMVKLLPEVLLNMSKLSATAQIAVPVLEFLSMLSRLPKVFSNFVADQYMSVFAIALPYTNPFKYNHYTVSLAHRVIAIWFLKCRTSFRRNFVEFIKNGLKQNVLVPFEGRSIHKCDILNEDSSSRKRSSSLTEQGSRRRERSVIGVSRSPMNDLKPPIDDELLTFHKELTETCMDLLARYAFATCSALPKRHPTADFILEGGQSATWLLGTKLITITTSGCTQKPVRNGLCSKCCQSCRQNVDRSRMSPKPDEKSKLSVSRSQSSEASSDQFDINTPVKGVISPSLSTTTSSPGEDPKKFSSHVDSNETFDLSRKDSFSSIDRLDKKQSCSCWCQSWAEICVRCPTGVMSWMIRVQNDRNFQDFHSDSSMFDVSTLFHPTLGVKVSNGEIDRISQYLDEEKQILEQCIINDDTIKMELNSKSQNRILSDPVCIPGSPLKVTPSRQISQENCEVDEEYFDEDYDTEEGRSRNPVRRSNSSPEMSSGWKNPFMKDIPTHESDDITKDPSNVTKHLDMFNNTIDAKKLKQNYSKDLRYGSKANCEAIPEEICGTGSTPPSNMCQPKPLTLNLNIDSTEKKNEVMTPEIKKNNDKERPKLQLKSTKLNSFNESDSSTKSSAESVDTKQTTEFPLVNYYQEEKSRSLTSTPSYLATKPPLSPPINYGQLYGSQTLEKIENDSDPPLLFRGRVHTLAVMDTIKKPTGLPANSSVLFRNSRTNPPKETIRSGINPSFVFLQLYHSTHFSSADNDAKPILLPLSQTMIQRAVQHLDWIPPYEFHKIGVIYVGMEQANSEINILRNRHGSPRYTEFLKGLGTLIKLSDVDPQSVFLGGLERDGTDGKFTYIWQDDIMQV
ncbi:tuberin-like isoform X2 [Daktulosphaira vitifoliae]|uniref:tuberin-like isoform X2 n=1 Tax=Daktulosphaira vitifoliae TaxID=58002 RepID=UPI0021AB0836|nr:tuberin-like isoform X2 [Daktulosphaira vitifoliae]